MTNEQYDRWKDFAVRMARVCFKRRRKPTSEWIIEVVTDFFGGFCEEDIPCVVDWDHSEPYSEGSLYFRRTVRCLCWHCSKAANVKSECRYGCEDGWIIDYAHPYCMGDNVALFLDKYRGSAPQCRGCREGSGRKCQCDDIENRFYEKWDEQWGGPVRCCIRAGLDCASAPSAGVVGFTAGHVRRMYPEGVPDWVFPPNERLKYWMTDKVNGTFAELPDDAGVVL